MHNLRARIHPRPARCRKSGRSLGLIPIPKVPLLSSIEMERQELDRNRKHLSALLEVKNAAEYE